MRTTIKEPKKEWPNESLSIESSEMATSGKDVSDWSGAKPAKVEWERPLQWPKEQR